MDDRLADIRARLAAIDTAKTAVDRVNALLDLQRDAVVHIRWLIGEVERLRAYHRHCPCCGSDRVTLVDIAFEVATGRKVPVGDTYQCENCLVYFYPGETCADPQS